MNCEFRSLTLKGLVLNFCFIWVAIKKFLSHSGPFSLPTERERVIVAASKASDTDLICGG